MLYLFEDCALDTERRELRRGSRTVAVEPQVFDLLIYLIQNRERVVSSDDLLQSIWNGRVVSESTLSSRITAARNAIGDNGKDQRLIKTLPRKGVRFVAGVQEQRTRLSSSAAPLSATGHATATMPLPDRPSIAVLPFANLSGDPDQEYFADGIVEDIITALARFPSLFVIARNSSFTYKARAVDIKQIGRDLGVRYILEGSVRKSGNRVRITGQLIAAETSAHAWAERYDGDYVDIFALQDEMTASIVGALIPSIQRAEIERARRKPPESLDAYDLYLRGLAAYFTGTRPGNDEALQLLQRAVQLEPTFIPAIIAIENCWARRYTQSGSPLPEAFAEIVRYASLAVQIDPDNAEALAVLSRRTPSIKQDYQEAISLAERAVSINPNSAFAWRQSGFGLVYSGEANKALEHFKMAMRLSPRDPTAGDAFHGMGLALIQLERDAEAVAAARRSILQSPNIVPGWRTLSAALALSGQLADARNALRRVLELDPACSVTTMATRIGYCDTARRRLFDGWRRAGMPE